VLPPAGRGVRVIDRSNDGPPPRRSDAKGTHVGSSKILMAGLAMSRHTGRSTVPSAAVLVGALHTLVPHTKTGTDAAGAPALVATFARTVLTHSVPVPEVAVQGPFAVQAAVPESLPASGAVPPPAPVPLDDEPQPPATSATAAASPAAVLDDVPRRTARF